LRIEVVSGNRDIYKKIMLIADPEENAIDRYINNGTLIAMYDDTNCIGVCHYSCIGNKEAEINNISLEKSMQGKGYGSILLKFTIEYIISNGYKSIVLGTGNSSIGNIAFYQKNGFDLQEIWRNYFIDNYDEEIYENGIQCKHMLRFKYINQ